MYLVSTIRELTDDHRRLDSVVFCPFWGRILKELFSYPPVWPLNRQRNESIRNLQSLGENQRFCAISMILPEFIYRRCVLESHQSLFNGKGTKMKTRRNLKTWLAILVFLLAMGVGIQPALGTRFIPSDPDIGTWDETNRIYTLITDVYETIEIAENNLTLDGDGHHKVTGVSEAGSSGVYVAEKSGITIENLEVVGFEHGILIEDWFDDPLSQDITLNGNTASNCGWGIKVDGCTANTLTNNKALSNSQGGIWIVQGCVNSILTGNTASGNRGCGIRVEDKCANTTLTDNIAEDNGDHGIHVGGSSDNTLTGNTTLGNFGFGISIHGSIDTLVADNTCTENRGGIGVDYHADHTTLMGNIASNNGDNGGIYILDCDDNTIIGNTCNSNAGFGISIGDSTDNTVIDNTASDNYEGITVWVCQNNTLTGNTASDNHFTSEDDVDEGCGIRLDWNSEDQVTNNTLENNDRGIWLHECTGNRVFNNNFISNSIQAYVTGGGDNIFNEDKPTGGNYWSDWTGPDENGDGFVDNPYVIIEDEDEEKDVQDDLPWAGPSTLSVQQLIAQLAELDLPRGTAKSLNAKLKNIVKKLNDSKIEPAINSLNAFINAVEAQQGKKISQYDAEDLISAARAIIEVLGSM